MKEQKQDDDDHELLDQDFDENAGDKLEGPDDTAEFLKKEEDIKERLTQISTSYIAFVERQNSMISEELNNLEKCLITDKEFKE
jgi:hypothetical protein